MTIEKRASTFAGIDLNLRVDNTCRVADRKTALPATPITSTLDGIRCVVEGKNLRNKNKK